jgi:hypothetical protein
LNSLWEFTSEKTIKAKIPIPANDVAVPTVAIFLPGRRKPLRLSNREIGDKIPAVMSAAKDSHIPLKPHQLNFFFGWTGCGPM